MMTSIQPASATIFFELLNNLDNNGYKKFIREGFMPLCVELIGKLHTTFGSADAYSICHYYEQNGDLMRDPEMCFLLMPKNSFNELPNQIFPYYYRLDGLGIEQESITFEPGGIMLINPNLQKQHVDFANQWLLNIKEQGFLSKSN
jgi:hypothetical protein